MSIKELFQNSHLSISNGDRDDRKFISNEFLFEIIWNRRIFPSFHVGSLITNHSSLTNLWVQIISKYQIRLLYNPHEVEESLDKMKERTFSSSVKISSKNSEPNLFEKERTIRLCLRDKVLAQESRSICTYLYCLPEEMHFSSYNEQILFRVQLIGSLQGVAILMSTSKFILLSFSFLIHEIIRLQFLCSLYRIAIHV